MKNKEKGFSLIEIVCVISILGVLTLIIIPSFKSSRSKIQNELKLQEVQSIFKLAEKHAKAQNHNFYIEFGTIDNTINTLKLIDKNPPDSPITLQTIQLEKNLTVTLNTLIHRITYSPTQPITLQDINQKNLDVDTTITFKNTNGDTLQLKLFPLGGYQQILTQ